MRNCNIYLRRPFYRYFYCQFRSLWRPKWLKKISIRLKVVSTQKRREWANKSDTKSLLGHQDTISPKHKYLLPNATRIRIGRHIIRWCVAEELVRLRRLIALDPGGLVQIPLQHDACSNWEKRKRNTSDFLRPWVGYTTHFAGGEQAGNLIKNANIEGERSTLVELVLKNTERGWDAWTYPHWRTICLLWDAVGQVGWEGCLDDRGEGLAGARLAMGPHSQ